jgi:muconolactone delta-isomerase
MQFLTISRRRSESFAETEFAERVDAEREQARRLYAEGFIRQIWLRSDVAGSCIIVEAASEAEVRERLDTLPLFAAGMVEFSVIPLQPYAGFGPRR